MGKSQIHRIVNESAGHILLPSLVELAFNDPETFLDSTVSQIQTVCKEVKNLALVRGIKGTWRTQQSTNPDFRPPTELVDLMTEALDSESCKGQGSWMACPLEVPCTDGTLMVAEVSAQLDPGDFDSIAAAIASLRKIVRKQQNESRSLRRLQAILDMTVHWNQTRETQTLLNQMAETSTKLLSAERATIFLPEEPSGQLVGRPALGVEGGELRISPNQGVVGAVISSGQPQRVDEDIATEQAQINREVDEQLDFQTRTLICVPIINSADKTIGAFELINKIGGNFSDADQSDLVELAEHAAVAIENTQHVEKLVSCQKHLADEAANQVELIGNCEEIQKLKSTIERVAGTELAVLITGENGTGKEVVAQMIHYLSGRRDQILVAVNCAAITESLLESELFGHEKGAFTDALETRQGKFELAHEGTLFLDEIGDMTLGGQAKLLRVLEEKVVVRVGGSTTIPTEARVIAATNQDLPELVGEKKFREDLFFRLNVLTIKIPPLRNRGEDIGLLAEHFLNNFCVKARRAALKFTAAAKKRLMAHNWPGNVRELRNMMERLAYLFQGEKVDADDLEFIISPKRQTGPAFDLEQTLGDATRDFQVEYISQHIKRAGNNMTAAAEKLGLHRSNLYRKMRQLEMDGADDE